MLLDEALGFFIPYAIYIPGRDAFANGELMSNSKHRVDEKR